MDECVHIQDRRPESNADPPQLYLSHCKKESNRYVPVLPALAQELRTHLNRWRHGYQLQGRAGRYLSADSVVAPIHFLPKVAGGKGIVIVLSEVVR